MRAGTAVAKGSRFSLALAGWAVLAAAAAFAQDHDHAHEQDDQAAPPPAVQAVPDPGKDNDRVRKELLANALKRVKNSLKAQWGNAVEQSSQEMVAMCSEGVTEPLKVSMSETWDLAKKCKKDPDLIPGCTTLLLFCGEDTTSPGNCPDLLALCRQDPANSQKCPDLIQAVDECKVNLKPVFSWAKGLEKFTKVVSWPWWEDQEGKGNRKALVGAVNNYMWAVRVARKKVKASAQAKGYQFQEACFMPIKELSKLQDGQKCKLCEKIQGVHPPP